MLTILSAVLVAAAALVTVIVAGRSRFDAVVEAEVRAAFAAAPGPGGVIDVVAATRDLPGPARDYLRLALGDRVQTVTAVRLKHGGEFRLKPDGAWMDVRGEEYFTTSPPRYVWHATVRMAPGLWFEVRDFYRSGEGGVLAKVDSVVTVAQSGGEDVALSALIRWAGEAVWFPQAFLDGERFTWQAVNAQEAALVIRDGRLSARLAIHFGSEGWIDRITTEDRFLELDGHQVKRPFVVYCRDWRRVGGVLVPHEAEAAWKLEAGEFRYARFTIGAIEYNRNERY